VVTEHLAATESEPAKVMQRLLTITALMRDIVLDRKENPRDDILSMLWQVEIEGKPTTLEDIENYAVLLFIAGLDTVVNGMGHGIRHLASDPELQRQLRADPRLIAEAGEELLRRYTFTVPVRLVGKDGDFEGVTMKRGERALVFLPAADLDAAEFPNPEVYDLNRENNVHIAFGVGPHRCLGSHLARVELQVLYEEMLARLPEFRLDPANPPTFHGGNVIGVDRLNLLWN
jgi:cytochrome P450